MRACEACKRRQGWGCSAAAAHGFEIDVRWEVEVIDENFLMAEEFKKQGNDAFAAGKFDEAIGFFSQAIEIDPSNHVL